ncbi:MAG TPA: glycosyltransferase family 39 protein, partial [Chloroflexota bacterium]|nr:glycosyltransferase family 39 protein [Chloroflexota bacterium]
MDAPLEGPPPALPSYLRRIRRSHRVILGAILCVGAVLRYYGLNWDFGSGLHPDERHVTSLVQALALPTSWAQFLSPGHVSPLEPGDFAYGSLPLYLYWIAGHVAAWLGSWVPGLAAWQNALGSGAFLTGRIVSAAAGVLTILVVYLLGLRLYGRTVGLLAAAFFAVCVLDVQLSHFLAVDTLATLCATLAVYGCVCVAQQRRPADFLWAGAWTGAALACKVSVLPLLLPLVVAPFLTGDAPAAPAADAAGASPDTARG